MVVTKNSFNCKSSLIANSVISWTGVGNYKQALSNYAYGLLIMLAIIRN